MPYTDYDTRLAAYGVIVDDRDRILLALWNEGREPLWTMPGGGVEMEETVAQAAIREVREESGYDVALGAVLGVDSHVISPEDRQGQTTRPLKTVRVLFAATIVGGSLRDEVDGTTDEARWVPLADVATLARVPLVDIALGYWGSGRRVCRNS